jgi:hypothetical protein
LYVGVRFYSWSEGWNTREVFYFTAVTATTIGYGDYSPTSPGAQLFTIFYAFVGISLLYGGLKHAGEWLIARQEQATRLAIARVRRNLEERNERRSAKQALRSKRASEDMDADSTATDLQEMAAQSRCSKFLLCCRQAWRGVKRVITFFLDTIWSVFVCYDHFDSLIDKHLPGYAVIVKKMMQCLLPLFAYICIGECMFSRPCVVRLLIVAVRLVIHTLIQHTSHTLTHTHTLIHHTHTQISSQAPSLACMKAGTYVPPYTSPR